VERTRHAAIRVLLEGGSSRWIVRLADQDLSAGKPDGPMPEWDIALRGDAQVWQDHWRALPPVDAADIFGMRRAGRLVIEGNFLPFMRHLQVIKDVLALPRATR